MNKETNTMEFYLKLDYPITIHHSSAGGYFAEIEDLPGCMSEGETLDEVYQNIEQARKAWIEVAYEDNGEVPLPRTSIEYSGKFLMRLPKDLHRQLAEEARRQGVSLNQYTLSLISGNHARKTLLTEIERIRFENILDSEFVKQSLITWSNETIKTSYSLPAPRVGDVVRKIRPPTGMRLLLNEAGNEVAA